MSSLELQSTTFVPSHEIIRADTNQMYPDLSMWLGLDNNNNNAGDINDDLLLHNWSNLDYSPSYYSSMTKEPNFELMGNYQHNEALLNQCNGYNSYPLCNYDQFWENNLDVGHFQMCDKGDVGNVFSTYPISDSSNIYDAITQSETWGHQSRHTITSCGSENSSNSNKVGRYSLEERRDRILRYLHKKHLRNFRKTIKYACRKTLADRRVRVRGRFAKNQEEEMQSNQNHNATLTYFDYTKNEEYSDQDWLQEAIEALM
ncbi:hypothetical protein RND81_10G186700 [Saponaria officinalis]|uniref:CCT domain-containing protein n=1 Tax=Saponaria officinalis TaxID=3572 RepID=A0AAW1I3M8_SAPOF